MIICTGICWTGLGPRHITESVPFWGVNESLSDHIAARHLHGTCASRIRRVERPLCACLELRWTRGISDGKEDPDREGVVDVMGCGLG